MNVSGIAQEALRHVLAGEDTDHWLDRLERLPTVDVAHDDVLRALDEAREELGARG